jgi:hypothetical protein
VLSREPWRPLPRLSRESVASFCNFPFLAERRPSLTQQSQRSARCAKLDILRFRRTLLSFRILKICLPNKYELAAGNYLQSLSCAKPPAASSDRKPFATCKETLQIVHQLAVHRGALKTRTTRCICCPHVFAAVNWGCPVSRRPQLAGATVWQCHSLIIRSTRFRPSL